MKAKFVRKDLLSFLRGIFLNGIIDDIVLDFNSGKLSTRSIDNNSILFVNSFVEYSSNDKDDLLIGIKNFSLLEKIVSNLVYSDDVILDIFDDEIIVNNGTVKLKTSDYKYISTFFNKKEKLDDLLKNYENVGGCLLETNDLIELKNYLNVFNLDYIKIYVENNVLRFSSTDKDINKFNLKINKSANMELEDFYGVFYCKYFVSIINHLLDVLENNDNKYIQLTMVNKIPLMIKYNEVFWLLSPMNETE